MNIMKRENPHVLLSPSQLCKKHLISPFFYFLNYDHISTCSNLMLDRNCQYFTGKEASHLAQEHIFLGIRGYKIFNSDVKSIATQQY